MPDANANEPVDTGSIADNPRRKTLLGDLRKPIFDDSEFGRGMKEYYAAKARTLEALIQKRKSEAGIPQSTEGNGNKEVE